MLVYSFVEQMLCSGPICLYEGALGQKLNKDKTSIFSSANTQKETKDYILNLAGTRSTTCYGEVPWVTYTYWKIYAYCFQGYSGYSKE